MSAAERLAGFAQSAEPTAEALGVMRLCLFDWLVCARAARQDAVAQGALRYVRGGAGASLFFGSSSDTRSAALVNGTISHALDFDDTHFAHIGHVSTVVFPAAVAMGEARGADFDQVLKAALIGAEAATRFGVWLGRGHYQVGYHQTATAGAIGAAVAAGLAGGTADLQGALSNAGGFAAGLKAQFGTAMKPVNAGLAAAHGVEAVLMAEAGLTGNAAILEALAETHHGAQDAAAWEGMGARWLFEEVRHKFYPCCHGTHAMIEALSLLEAPRGLVEVRTNPRWMSVCNKPAPRDALEVKFSYKALAALVLAGRPVSDAAMHAMFPLSGEMQALMERVRVVADESVSETASVVTAGHAEARFDLRDPMPYATRLEKLTAKANAALPDGEAAVLWAAVQSGDLAQITALMGAS